MAHAHVLGELVGARAREGGAAWLDEARRAITAGERAIDVVFPAVSRKVGRDALLEPGAAGVPTALEVTIAGHRLAVPLAAWRVDDAARAALLLAERERDPGGALAAAARLYFQGDARERCGALRALSVVADGDGDGDDDPSLAAVLDAMRVNQGEIFEAALCDNAYAAARLPDLEYRKAVLKAIFIGLSIRRFLRLDERADAELCSSLLDFAHEREAATRAVPAELWPVIALHPPPGLDAKLLGYLEHPAPEQRAAAAVALDRLLHGGAEHLRRFLESRRARETDDTVAAILRAALAY